MPMICALKNRQRGQFEHKPAKMCVIFKQVRRFTLINPRSKPESPNDLQDWDWLTLAQVGLTTEFRTEGKPVTTLRPNPRLSVNDAHALYHLARSGAGLALVPEYLTHEDIAAGLVRRVLPDWNVASVGVYAVWPPNAPKEGLSALFINFLAKK